MKRILLLILVSGGVSSSVFAWWNPNWEFRKKVEIVNNAGDTLLTNYQVKVVLTDDNFNFSRAKEDGSDIRFVKDDDATVFEHWIQDYDTTLNNATIWVKLDTLFPGTDTIYVYYGNPNAPPSSSGENTFYFFDDFSDGNTDGWIEYGCCSNIEIYEGICHTCPYGALIGEGAAYNLIHIPNPSHYKLYAWVSEGWGNADCELGVGMGTLGPEFKGTNGFHSLIIPPEWCPIDTVVIAIHNHGASDASVVVDDIFIVKYIDPPPSVVLGDVEESIIKLETKSIAPGSCLAGEMVGMEELTLIKTIPNYPEWQKLRIDLRGTGEDKDIEEVLFFEDDGDNVFEPEADNLITKGKMQNGVCELTFQKQIEGRNSYFLAYLISPFASYNHEVGMGWLDNSYFTFSENSLHNDYFEFHSNNVKIGATIVVAEWENISPTYTLPGQKEVGMIKLKLKTNTGSAIVNKLLLDLAQGVPEYVSKVEVYKDENNNEMFDGSSIDLPLLFDFSPTECCTLSGIVDAVEEVGTYFISFDVADNVSVGETVEFKAKDRAYMKTTSITHGISPYNFPFEAGVIIYYGIELRKETAQLQCLLPGEKDVFCFKLQLKTRVGTSEWKGIRFVKIGTGKDNYIERVKLYQDKDGNEVLSPSDSLISSSGIKEGIAILTGFNEQLITSFKTYFVTMDLSEEVESGTTIGIRCPSYHFLFTSPTQVEGGAFPFEILGGIGGKVLSSNLKINPGAVNSGEEDVGLERLEIYTQTGVARWEGICLTIQKGNAQNIEEIKIYKDNGDKVFNPSDETLIGRSGVVNDSVKIIFSAPEIIDTVKQYYFVAISVSNNAAEDTLEISCKEEGFFFTADVCFEKELSSFVDIVTIKVSVSVEETPKIPTSYVLQVKPNLVTSNLQITFGLPRKGKIHLKIYDVGGREVLDIERGEFTAGYHTFKGGVKLSKGIYFVVFRYPEGVKKQKILKIR